MREPLEVCPRRALRGVIDRAASMGYDAQFGLEFEWFNFAETPAVGARQGLPRPDTAHARHVRLLDPAPDAEPAVLRRVAQRAAGVRRAARGAAHRDRPRRVRSGDPLHVARSKPPTGRSCSSRRPRRSATASASCRRSWPAGTSTCRAAPATPTRACGTSTARNVFFDDAAPDRMSDAVPLVRRRHPRAAARAARALRADGEQLQAAGRRVLGADQADVGHRQPHGRLPGHPRIGQVDPPRAAGARAPTSTRTSPSPPRSAPGCGASSGV